MDSASDASRKEWRIVPEQSLRTTANEDLDRTKLDQSDERLIFEVQRGREQVDVDFVLDNNMQRRLHAVSKQREELQQLEIELRAQAIIVGMQNSFNAQIKEHSNANVNLQEQLHEREQRIIELERRMSDKERELHAVKLDNEAAWAKEDLLREQNKELQSYRRDRDNSEAERAQHIKQIHDLQEHTQEKEHQLMELQEQQRIAQETILFKDEQLRDAQAWITRAQEVDAFQTTTSQTLQAELRERTEQYNQLCLVCQRQFAELERFYLHIQQLQLEMADLREKSGIYPDGSHVTAQMIPNDASKLAQGNGNQLEVNGNSSAFVKSDNLQNGNSENASSFPPEVNSSTQTDHVQSVAFAPTSLLGMSTYLPNGQVTALHPFVMHQQGIPHPSQITQSTFQSGPAMSALQNWQNQQILPNGQLTHDQYHQQTEQNLPRAESQYEVNGQVVHANFLNTNPGQRLDADSVAPIPTGEVGPTDNNHDNVESQQSMQQISSQFHDALRLDPLGHGNDTERKNAQPVGDQGLNFMAENSGFSVNLSSSEPQTHPVTETIKITSPSAVSTDDYSPGHKNTIDAKSGDEYLLDERALLASVARTIGSGGRIRITSTLPNRLGKMLAPLHWHDYKRKYGKLDNFVASHPELFLIEGDYIQLREGAQEIIAAKAAVAKVAAAAAASAPSPYSSLLPSVALTPMARSHRSRNASSLESSSMNAADKGVSSVKILTKPKDQVEMNSRSALLPSGNGKPGLNLVGKQQNRTVGAASIPRR